MKLKSSEGVGVLIILIVYAFMLYNSGYNSAEEEIREALEYEEGSFYDLETYEKHEDYCDGDCHHVLDSIESRIENDELIDRSNLFDQDGVFSEDDLETAYWEGAYDGYIQGYGDCYFGNEREQDLNEYVDENMF